MKEEKEIKLPEDSERYVLTFLNYRIYADKYQYTVKKKIPGKKGEALQGFFRTISSALEDIRITETRLSILNAKTLDKAIDLLIKFNTEFNKLLEPLKKLEN